MMPPTAPQPKPSTDSFSPVRPKIRISIAGLRSAGGAAMGRSWRAIADPLTGQFGIDVADQLSTHRALAGAGRGVVGFGIEVEVAEQVEVKLSLALQPP